MTGTFFSKLTGACRRHPVLLGLALLAVLGLGGTLGTRVLWANHHYRIAQDALQARDFDRARAHLTLGLRLRPTDASLHLLLARTERLAGNFDEAQQQLDRCRKLQGPSEAIDVELAMLRVQNGDLYGSEAVLLPHLEGDGEEADLILEALAQGYQKAYRWLDALGCLNRLLERRPDHVPALVLRGQTYEHLFHPAEAVADFRRAVALNPEDEWPRVCLGEVLLVLHQPDEAEQQFDYLAQRQESNPAVLLGLARCRYGQSRLEEAARLLERLCSLCPQEGPIWSDRGQVAMADGRLSDAEEYLRRAVRLRPYDYTALYTLYQCLERRGKKDEARSWQTRFEQIARDRERLNDLTKLLLKNPSALQERCEAGLACLRLGQNEDARGWLEGVVRQDPHCAAAHRGLAEYYDHAGNAAAARHHRELAEAARRFSAGELPVASGRP